MQSSDGGGQTEFIPPRTVDASDIGLPDGYRAEAVATNLNFPTGITFDDAGNLYVVESGYAYGEVWTLPRLLKQNADGAIEVIAAGDQTGPWNGIDYSNGFFYITAGDVLHGGHLLRISSQGEQEILIDDLPSVGDHHTNGPVIGPDGAVYFGQGTATNSGVVGVDNYRFGWLERFADFHDIPCKDITLTGQNFTSENPLTEDPEDKVATGAFVPFGTSTTEGMTVKGQVPCSGSVMRWREGSGLELVAWGFRNPFGLAFSPEGKLYATDNGYDVRGSRPVFGAGDILWHVEEGQWYGWPDYSGGHALDSGHFDPPGSDIKLQSLMADHPEKMPHPRAILGVHSSSCGIDFSFSQEFGYAGQAFIAQFGDMAPGVGKVLSPVGFKVVRVDANTGVITDFAVNKDGMNAPASLLNTGGLERPVSVKFSPDGRRLYIVDFGVMLTGENGPVPVPNTGVIWRITREDGR